MEHENEFTFLKLEINPRKNSEELKEDEKYYAIVSLLDNKQNIVKFFVFKKEIIDRLLSKEFIPMNTVLVKYEVVNINNKWNVRLVDING